MPEPLTDIGVATDGTSIYLVGGYVTDFKTTDDAHNFSDEKEASSCSSMNQKSRAHLGAVHRERLTRSRQLQYGT